MIASLLGRWRQRRTIREMQALLFEHGFTRRSVSADLRQEVWTRTLSNERVVLTRCTPFDAEAEYFRPGGVSPSRMTYRRERLELVYSTADLAAILNNGRRS